MAFDVVRPVYTVYQYTESIYKVVKFKHTDSLPRFEDSTNEKSDTVRFDSSISRSRRIVLELALCNHWDYFFTGTIAPVKHDRYDWDTLRKKFKESVKYWRKKYDCDILYLVIPEHHKNGAWHILPVFPLPALLSLLRVCIRISWLRLAIRCGLILIKNSVIALLVKFAVKPQRLSMLPST